MRMEVMEAFLLSAFLLAGGGGDGAGADVKDSFGAKRTEVPTMADFDLSFG